MPPPSVVPPLPFKGRKVRKEFPDNYNKRTKDYLWDGKVLVSRETLPTENLLESTLMDAVVCCPLHLLTCALPMTSSHSKSFDPCGSWDADDEIGDCWQIEFEDGDGEDFDYNTLIELLVPITRKK